MKWQPNKVIERAARALQVRARRAIARTAPRVPHPDTKGPVGGSLSRAVMRRSLVEVKPWGVVIKWASLGHVFMFFVRGTKRQKARPIPLRPDVPKLVRELQADADRHWRKRAQGTRGDR